MTLRVTVKDLGGEVIASLDRGEAVEIERNGTVVARIEVEPAPEALNRRRALGRVP